MYLPVMIYNEHVCFLKMLMMMMEEEEAQQPKEDEQVGEGKLYCLFSVR